MGIFAKLFGSKSNGVQALTSLIDAIRRDNTVDASVLDACLLAEGAHDPFEINELVDSHFVFNTMLDLAATNPAACCDVAAKCVAKIEEALFAPDETRQTLESSVLYAMVILTRILSVAHSAPAPPQKQEPGAPPPPPPLVEALWAHASFDKDGNKHEQPLPERIVCAAMGFLFLDDVCVRAPTKEVEVNGIDAARLWRAEVGVGEDAPKDFAQPAADDETQAARMFGLGLLLCAVFGQAPLAETELMEAKNKETEKPTSAGIALDTPRRLKDTRLLAFLVDPSSEVPFRRELFFSLLSAVCAYQSSSSVPYASFFFTSNVEEVFVHSCVQALCMLLNDSVNDDGAFSLMKWFPQKTLGERAPPVTGEGGRHFFRELVMDLSGGEEATFLAVSLGTMFQSFLATPLLPNSVRLPSFQHEMLLVVLHLSSSEMFINATCREGVLNTLVGGVIALFDEAPDHIDSDNLALLIGATLMRLTSLPVACAALNEEYVEEVSDQLPSFHGSGCDMVALLALKQVSDRLPRALVDSVQSVILDVYLGIIVNLSSFAEGFSTQVSLKMYTFFERCAKACHVKRGVLGPVKYLTSIIEAMQNILQYQYSHSASVVYSLMTRQSIIAELFSSVSAAAAEGRLSLEAAETSDEQMDEAVIKRRQADVELWEKLQADLTPLVSMIDMIVPELERAIEKNDIHDPEDAKECLPKTAIGLLPVPHAVVLRNIGYIMQLDSAIESCCLACAAVGPYGSSWEQKVESEAAKADAKKVESKAATEDAKKVESKDSAARRGQRPPSTTRSSSRTNQVTSPRSSGGGYEGQAAVPIVVPQGGAQDPAAVLAALTAQGIDITALLAQAAAAQAAAQGGSQEATVAQAAAQGGSQQAADAQAPTQGDSQAAASQALTQDDSQEAVASQALTQDDSQEAAAA
eukprot:TRINITY_DN3235_c0_g1_i1.p1 TRINITY_DN3235_c0_g1~~TRINITY_DN3235_c0_g1_i1.p1  ORF type:complete len:920 (+),score=222.38 TRINITY_DN3235_c0_g1_i1:56-2815(+)